MRETWKVAEVSVQRAFTIDIKIPDFGLCITRGLTSKNQGNQRPVSHLSTSLTICLSASPVHSSATAKKFCRRLQPLFLLRRARARRVLSSVIGPAIKIAAYYNHSLVHCNAIISVLFLRPLVTCPCVVRVCEGAAST